MTVLHNEEQPISLKGLQSEHHNCIDCGYNTFPGAPPRELAEFLMERDGAIPHTITEDSEIYIVKDKVWKAAGMEPYGGCLCVVCLERRIGRRLKPKDFDRNHSSPETSKRPKRCVHEDFTTTESNRRGYYAGYFQK
jgi:hypothetical protein